MPNESPLHAQPPSMRPELVGPSSFYLTGEDNLRVQSFNAASGVELAIRGRMLTPDGLIVPFELTHTPNTDRSVKSTLHQMGDGWLLNLYAVASAGAPVIGQTFIEVQIVRGLSGAVLELATLLQGVVSAAQRLAWPGSPIVSTIASPGNIRVVVGTNPAAGAEIAETVPTGARWRLLSFIAQLTCSAVVANRRPILVLDDGANATLQSDPPEAQVASQSHQWVAGAGTERLVATSNVRTWAMPALILLPAGHRIRTATTGLDPGDDWGTPRMVIEEWIEGA